MPGKAYHRDVGPFLQIFRDILRGRRTIPPLRFADEQAARTQPPPDVPGGPYHRTTKIYYFTRDARRLVQPPSIISQAQIAAKDAETSKPKSLSPGTVYLK